MDLFKGNQPLNLGVRKGRLMPVPDSPNAVSSQADSAYHAIAPITYEGSAQHAMEKLLGTIRNYPRARIVEAKPDYVRAEFSSRWLGFVDDVELWFEPDKKLIQVRSASRLGYRDFGVNRRRIEALRALLARG